MPAVPVADALLRPGALAVVDSHHEFARRLDVAQRRDDLVVGGRADVDAERLLELRVVVLHNLSFFRPSVVC
jgi:hypothetical protein